MSQSSPRPFAASIAWHVVSTQLLARALALLARPAIVRNAISPSPFGCNLLERRTLRDDHELLERKELHVAATVATRREPPPDRRGLLRFIRERPDEAARVAIACVFVGTLIALQFRSARTSAATGSAVTLSVAVLAFYFGSASRGRGGRRAEGARDESEAE